MTITESVGDEKVQQTWEDHVLESNNGTVFQSLRFLGYHSQDRFCNRHLEFHKRERLFAVMPAALCSRGDGTVLSSHPGASFGGGVFQRAVSFHDASTLLSKLTAYAAEISVDRIEITPTPVAYQAVPDQTFEYALIKHGYQYRKREFTSIVPLQGTREDILVRLPQKTRADVRQALGAGIEIQWADHPSDAGLKVMYDMLLANRADLGLCGSPTHSLAELQLIRDRLPGMLSLGTAQFEGRTVASTLVFRCNSRGLLTFYICHDREARDVHPVHLLLYDLICRGAGEGYRILDFGISTINMQPLNSLIRFKESFGAYGCFRDTFEMQI